MPDKKDTRRKEKLASFERLLDIMDELREKCPWDKRQTLESLRHLTIEETYELSDAVLESNMDEIKKELGDLMVHLVFYARIASESGAFDIANVLEEVCEKLVKRHPHIYGDLKVKDEKEVKQNWEKIKLREGKRKVLGGVPISLPAMVKAMRIQEKAAGIGFDWEKSDQVWEKVMEELNEFIKETNPEKKKQEFGDLIFSLINYARFVDINPEEALERTNKKFIKRFDYLEKQTRVSGKVLTEMTLEEMDKYWEESKKIK